MFPLYTQEEFDAAKSRDKLPLKCKHCGKTFYQTKHFIHSGIRKHHPHTAEFCSQKCSVTFRSEKCNIEFNCEQCGKLSYKLLNQYKRSKHHFCSSSCSATFQNRRKQTGCRRSKMEAWLEKQLISLYPYIEFHFNRRDAINAELDIYIPSLKLAFELNGIFHYEPIFGQDKLNRTQTNDNRKFQACIESGIELCILDTSQVKYFKERTSKPFLDIITRIINQTLSPSL